MKPAEPLTEILPGKTEEGAPSVQSSPSKDGSQPKIPELAIPLATRQSWDLIDEIVQILKTAFPLLILTLETVVEQIAQRFKASAEEEIYRLTCMLLQDAMQVRLNHTIQKITTLIYSLAIHCSHGQR